MIKSQVANKYGLVFPREFDCRYCGRHVVVPIDDLTDKRSVYCSARCERQFWRFVTKKHPTHLTNYPSEQCYRWIEEHENAKAKDISDVAGL